MKKQSLDGRQSKKVLICDDEPRTRQALKTLLLTREITCNNETSSMIHVVGEARAGYETLQLVETMMPEVVMIDALMPGMDRLDALFSPYSKSTAGNNKSRKKLDMGAFRCQLKRVQLRSKK
jgi:PleD family two-component response regulator